jgi:S1-C subfamily serine protease
VSGGPTIDTQGRVVGVNVSELRNAELLNFLVPVSHARALIAAAKDSAPNPALAKELWVLTHPDLCHAARIEAVFRLLHRELGKHGPLLRGSRVSR